MQSKMAILQIMSTELMKGEIKIVKVKYQTMEDRQVKGYLIIIINKIGYNVKFYICNSGILNKNPV